LQFADQTVFHRVFATSARGGDQPAHRQSFAAFLAHFDGHLIGGTTDAA